MAEDVIDVDQLRLITAMLHHAECDWSYPVGVDADQGHVDLVRM